ncbi:LPXTG cell wall anchor domain-containing protein [Streptomyces huasconensis]|uniref:LPXTG cell wall anchor domain-containing protein n=1 Tax=Streptomyces huasconensis TaxID=1854574 RepID=UPI0034017F14
MRFRSSPPSGVATTVATSLVTSLVTTLATALASTVVAAPAAAEEPGAVPQVRRQPHAAVPPPSCAPADRVDFPLDTRIHEGPAAYRPGGDRQEWAIDLTNATDEPCVGVHPILVLVGQRQPLLPEQIRLEFHDGTRWRAVPFERTDQDENVGVLDDGFPGFTVGPARTVTVRVRLAFTSDALPNRVVASAALVQRRENDGDWVGDSNDYGFAVEADAPDAPASDTPGSREPSTAPPETIEQLAQTGPATLLGVGAAAGALLLGGAALLARYRRLRATGR